MSPPEPLVYRGEVWWVNLDPTIGSEIRKTRPAVVISSDAVGKLPVKVIVPLTDWSDAFQGNVWHVPVSPSRENGLVKDSAADALQIRSVSLQRFHRRIGRLTENQMEEIATAVAIVVEAQ